MKPQANKTRNPKNYKLKIYSAHTQHRQKEDLEEKILDQISQTFQPMNINFGLLPPIKGVRAKKERYQEYTKRAKKDWISWFESLQIAERKF